MSVSSYTLFLFTTSFPYGQSETFLENELPVLAESFDRIYIFPLTQQKIQRPLPEGAHVVDVVPESSKKALLWRCVTIWRILRKDHNLKQLPWKRRRYFWTYLSHLAARSIALEQWFSENPAQGKRAFYSYWMDEWVTVLSILKKRRVIPGFISRVHGFDLFEERQEDAYIPFRSFQLEGVDQVHSVSRMGADYLRNRYAGFKHKIDHRYLGVPDRGIAPFSPGNEMVVMSCSNVIPLKRVPLIAQALGLLDFPVRWVHFGDGEAMDLVHAEVQKLPDNIRVELKGHAANQDVMGFLKEHTVNLFINVSETEGLPVSIMEAISFGVPVLATDVGGVSEIVTRRTGRLLPEDLNSHQLANAISDALNSKLNTLAFREDVRKFWQENFEAGVNYRSFANSLKE